MVEVRAAALDDADALGRVHAASWRVAYAELGPGFLATVEDTERAALWERVINDPTAHGDVLVAELDGALAGLVNLRRSRDTDAPDHVGEVIALYVAPDAWGTGCGRALLDAAVGSLEAQGFTEATLWVLDTNRRARRFYEIAGWFTDGESMQVEWRTAPIREVRYRRSLP
ncbi:MAG: GNAT family N-acetyltransferase [Acidimicrobiales bacterium]|nr:GNAT family N-acetyltransferase [Acidimicrobiales bacterium]